MQYLASSLEVFLLNSALVCRRIPVFAKMRKGWEPIPTPGERTPAVPASHYFVMSYRSFPVTQAFSQLFTFCLFGTERILHLILTGEVLKAFRPLVVASFDDNLL